MKEELENPCEELYFQVIKKEHPRNNEMGVLIGVRSNPEGKMHYECQYLKNGDIVSIPVTDFNGFLLKTEEKNEIEVSLQAAKAVNGGKSTYYLMRESQREKIK